MKSIKTYFIIFFMLISQTINASNLFGLMGDSIGYAQNKLRYKNASLINGKSNKIQTYETGNMLICKDKIQERISEKNEGFDIKIDTIKDDKETYLIKETSTYIRTGSIDKFYYQCDSAGLLTIQNAG